MKARTKAVAVIAVGALALGNLTGCGWFGGDDSCDDDAIGVVLLKPGGGSGGGSKGGSGSKSKPKTNTNKTKPKSNNNHGTTTKHHSDIDCD